MTSDGRLIHAWDLTKYPATPLEDFWTDEDRAVIYESGLIDPDAEYDPSAWANDGWESYQIPYSYEIPAEYYSYDVGYDMGYDAGYASEDTVDWESEQTGQDLTADVEGEGEASPDPGSYEETEVSADDYSSYESGYEEEYAAAEEY